jgi:hypothetical protein
MSKWIVRNGVLQIEPTCIRVGSPEWFSWLAQAVHFSYDGENGNSRLNVSSVANKFIGMLIAVLVENCLKRILVKQMN